MRTRLQVSGLLLFLFLFPRGLHAEELEIHVQDGEARIRPLESVVLQVRAFRLETDEEGNEERVRVLPPPARFELKPGSEGWLSKPFRNQTDHFQEQSSDQGWKSILGNFGRSLITLDSVLYTAPEKSGTCVVLVTAAGQTASLELHVSPRASSRRVGERSFGAEPQLGQPYRDLAAHWSPMIAQATWFEPKADYLARFDFDGDWKGDNNWDNLFSGSSQAYVYYVAAETETHWFLIYNFFHPRDYSDNCIGGTCHENDSEGVILTISKDGTRFGRLQVMETLAHDNIYSYRADRKVKKRAHSIDGQVEFYQSTHPVVFVESGGHGVYGSRDRRSRFNLRRQEFRDTTGLTYVYGARAERPLHPDDRLVLYELLPALSHWWRRIGGDTEAFDGEFRYEPLGERPGASRSALPAAFKGRRHGRNKAKPFWGWEDRRTRKKNILGIGQWALDPAYAVSRNLKLPAPFSLTYTYNPYLRLDGLRRSRRK